MSPEEFAKMEENHSRKMKSKNSPFRKSNLLSVEVEHKILKLMDQYPNMLLSGQDIAKIIQFPYKKTMRRLALMEIKNLIDSIDYKKDGCKKGDPIKFWYKVKSKN